MLSEPAWGSARKKQTKEPQKEVKSGKQVNGFQIFGETHCLISNKKITFFFFKKERLL